MRKMIIDRTLVSYTDEGVGPLVVMLHDRESAPKQLRSIIDLLGKTCRVVAPDLPVSGNTDTQAAVSLGQFANEVRIVKQFIRRLGEDAHLVGHASGGGVALRAALENCFRLQTLTLVDPVSANLLYDGDEQSHAYFHEVADAIDPRTEALARGGTGIQTVSFGEHWKHDGTWDDLYPGRRHAFTNLTAAVERNFQLLAWNADAGAQNVRPNVPTMTLRGTEPMGLARRIAARTAALVSGMRLPIKSGELQHA